MLSAYTSDQIRTAEAALMAKLPDGTLMDRAATGLAMVCAALLGGVYGSRVVLLVGSGDNGGDALFAGARLAARGSRVDAILAGTRVHEAGLAALRRAGGRALDVREAGDGWRERARTLTERADLVMDGLLGIGGAGALREPYSTLAELTHETDGPLVVAVDVPSGVDATTGRVEGEAVRADYTVTFGAYKAGLFVSPGARHTGRIEFVDIGLGPYTPEPAVTALTDADVAATLPRPDTTSDKYRRGVVGVVAGSHGYTGAAVLAVGGAVRSGAGMVRYAGVAEPVAQVRARWPEAVITELAPGEGVGEVGRVQAWVLGPGLGTGAESLALEGEVGGHGEQQQRGGD
ncbi:NAD(P)H-hydrate epimerase, partial [Streptosporangium saharense]|uniref:NAD(P)H-hydrate epimerase n=1 Tax=Streptosporangium saharense TaxID=1706840 RepID=UPI00331EB279